MGHAAVMCCLQGKRCLANVLASEAERHRAHFVDEVKQIAAVDVFLYDKRLVVVRARVEDVGQMWTLREARGLDGLRQQPRGLAGGRL